jgi:hypothetical protein
LLALGAASLAEARAAAERELAHGPHCRCCVSPRVHLAQWVGSLLFLDDDPAELQRALPVGERAEWPLRRLAACITLWGRVRVSPYERC